MQTGLVLSHKTLPMWVLRLLVITFLLPPLVAGVDGLARARRRRLSVGRWVLWTLSCALPFFSCALLAWVLGALGVLGEAPSGPVPPAALTLDGTAITALVAVALTFALAWLLSRKTAGASGTRPKKFDIVRAAEWVVALVTQGLIRATP